MYRRLFSGAGRDAGTWPRTQESRAVNKQTTEPERMTRTLPSEERLDQMLSNSSTISASGAGVTRLTTTIMTQPTMKAGSSS